jgi:hypothetical protein
MLVVRVMYIYTIATYNSFNKHYPRALRTKHDPYQNQCSFAKYFVGQTFILKIFLR